MQQVASLNNARVYVKNYKTRGFCYGHKFRRFLPIFGDKIGVFVEKQSMP
jgi:hypothetical protein